MNENQVHRSDHDFNPDVLNAIAMAKLTKTPRDYMDCLNGGKSIQDIRDAKETQRIETRKAGLDKEIGDER